MLRLGAAARLAAVAAEERTPAFAGAGAEAVSPLEVTVLDLTPEAERVAGWAAEEDTEVVWRRGVATRPAADGVVPEVEELRTAEDERVGTEVVRPDVEVETEPERVWLEEETELPVDGRLAAELERDCEELPVEGRL